MVEVRIGDIVTTDTTFFGSPITYRLTIKTQDAANYATELVNKPNASFKLERSAPETSAARPCVWRTGCRHQAVCDKHDVCVPGGESPDETLDRSKPPVQAVCDRGWLASVRS